MKQMGSNPLSYWWLSFAGDEGFRGACIVEGRDFTDVLMKTWAKGLNPGGEVQAIELTGWTDPSKLLPFVPDKLYSKADIDAIDTAVRWDT